MTEDQVRLFPALRQMPIYDESDERVHGLIGSDGRAKRVRECSRLAEVEECLTDPALMPLGGVKVGTDGTQVVVVYFGPRG